MTGRSSSPDWHGRLERPAGRACCRCRTTCRTRGPLNTSCLLFVLVVDGGTAAAPSRGQVPGDGHNCEDMNVCSVRPCQQGTDLIARVVGGWVLAALGGHCARARRLRHAAGARPRAI